MLFVEVVRLFVVLLGTAAGYWLARDLAPGEPTAWTGVGGVLGCLAGYVSGGFLGRLLARAVGAVERRADRLPAPQVVAGLLGALAGGFVGLLGGAALLVVLEPAVALPLLGLMVWVFAFTGYRVVARQSDRVFQALGLSTRPLVRATPFGRSEGFLVDTSTIVDGRLLALARAGLLDGDLLVPRFVLDELQGLADATEVERSRRARRGMELLDTLRQEAPARVYVLDDEVPEIAEVDAKLLALARRLQIRLMTSDTNLARNAELQGIPTTDLRRLTADLAPVRGPGDVVRCALVKSGREPGQGVGYLDDDTMVVVNGGDALVGRGPQEFAVTAVVPTAMGRILFARPPEAADPESADPEPAVP